MTESIDRPTATEQDVPGVTTQVTQNDVGSAEDLAAAYEESLKAFDEGDIVTGTVVKVDKDEVLLDIGYKSEGVIPTRELSIRHDVDPHEVVSLGDEIEALVLQKEDKEGRLILSKKRAQYERAWGTIEQIKENDGVVEGPVIEVVKGGLILDIGLRGFLPASLVELRRVRDLQPYVGRTLEAKIIELDKNRNNVVLSRRAYLEETQPETRDEFLANLQAGRGPQGRRSVGRQLRGVRRPRRDGRARPRVRAVVEARRPPAPRSSQVGEEVRSQVLDVDLDRERISLSLKATQQDPWQAVRQRPPGRRAGLGPGHQARAVRGLRAGRRGHRGSRPHLRDGRAPRRPARAGRLAGEEITVKIIDIDLERRRISLSIKQAAEDQAQLTAPEDELALEGCLPVRRGRVPRGGVRRGRLCRGRLRRRQLRLRRAGQPDRRDAGHGHGRGVPGGRLLRGRLRRGGPADRRPADRGPAGRGQAAEAPAAEAQPAEGQAAAEGEQAEAADAGQAPSDDTLENIVEDLKRKNAAE